MKAPHRDYDFQKNISGCGVFGLINKDRSLTNGTVPIKAMCTMHDRGNGMGGGFAAYGIYPDRADQYAFHILANYPEILHKAQEVLEEFFDIHLAEPIPTRKVMAIKDPPLTWRFFITPKTARPKWKELSEEDYIYNVVKIINTLKDNDAFVVSSGKNMGAFKGVGFPEDVADFFMLENYDAYIWTAHNRFPTNTQGWWGGAHPFTFLNWSVVHNGEISSYGINKRYLEEYKYACTMHTDTEVVAYLIDMITRKHGLSKRVLCSVFAPPFWEEIDRMPAEQKEAYTALRMVYGQGLLNGPFAILVSDGNCLMGLNDRIKLRPLVVADHGKTVYMSSEESSIREVDRELDRVWMPKAGEPVIVDLESASHE